MRRRHSLRFRVGAAFAGFGALVSVLFALGIWIVAHDVSQRLIDESLRAELDDTMARQARNPGSLPPDTATLRGHFAPSGNTAAVPAPLRGLAPGLHDLVLDGVVYRAAVADGAGGRHYLLFDTGHQRLRERRFLGWLAGGALLMTLLSSAGGYWLAGRVIAPVTELARAVGQAPAENPPRLSADDQPEDEISELRRSFDRYLERLAAFNERERVFAADASHELRTPLAVIRSTAEVLAEDAALSPAQAQRVARIERAAAGMSALAEALLLLSREQGAPVEQPCDCARLVRESVDRHRAVAARRRTGIALVIDAEPRLLVAPAFFSIVVDNLVRNAVAHTDGGDIDVRLAGDRLVVADTGTGIRHEDLERVFQRHYRGADSGGAGIGLSLVKRVCDRQGWQIALEGREGAGTTATLRFS